MVLIPKQTNAPLVVPSPVLPEVDYWLGKHLGAGAMVASLRGTGSRATRTRG
ncbi:MAG: hypothetical protein WDA71_04140 [Actinomycetota bacterium]